MFAALAERLPANAVVIEETPSSQPELYRRIPIRAPLGFVSTANGALGFGISGAIGLRMGLPDRPVVALLGDGSSIYAIQVLWSAAQYQGWRAPGDAGERGLRDHGPLAQDAGGAGPWPSLHGVDIAGIARGLRCPSVRVESHRGLLRTFDEVIPELTGRGEPLLVEVAVAT